MDQLSRDIEVLKALDDREIDALRAISVVRRYAKDETVLREGVPAEALCCLLRGAMRVTAVVVEGDELFEHDEEQLVKLGPGEVFGELSFITGDPPSLSVVASEASLVVELPQQALHALLEKEPALARKLHAALVRAMVQRLRSTSRDLFLARYFVRER